MTLARAAPLMPGVVGGPGAGESAPEPEVRVVTLGNGNGLLATLTNHGARLVSFLCPDREGRLADVVLGFDSVDGYRRHPDRYFGCTVGRVANRIARAAFTLDGEEYRLAANEGRNHIHGGARRSLDKVVWTTDERDLPRSVRFGYTSPHLEEGYPGALSVEVTWSLTVDDELRIDYVATSDRPGPVSLTNHTYWNLAGAGSGDILDHEIQVSADAYTPTDDELIPDGRVVRVDGTPLDLRAGATLRSRVSDLLGSAARGIDHNFVLPADDGLRQVASVCDPRSGRLLELSTTQPGIQVYTGNQLAPTIGKGGATYPRYGGFCLEPQGFPDAVNRPEFPSVILRPGATYAHSTVLAFRVR